MTTFAHAAMNTPQQSFTANGMITLDNSADPTVDLFFNIAASRKKDLNVAFASAYAADPALAMKLLFWARDARGGAGERDTFRRLMQRLEITNPSTLLRNLSLIPVYGRWDDLLIFSTPRVKIAAYDLINRALRDGNGLAAKWCPRKGPIANELRKYMNLEPKAYRQLVVGLTKVVEQQMCSKEWDQINYSHVPSVAASRYMKAFNKHDKDRYSEWKSGLKTGATKVNASVLFPYEVVKSVQYGDRDVSLAQWDALPNYLGDDKILPLIDVSSSMNCPVGGQQGVGLTCMDAAVSLGLYVADKQTGAFKDCFLTFTSKSRMNVLKGDFLQKLEQLRRSDWEGSTNIESAFNEILRVATANQLPASEMPRYLLILSDMEFNYACRDGQSVGVYDLARKMYTASGYELPKIVFWNLNARSNATGNTPVRFDQQGTALVGGFSPSIVKGILAAKNFTPRDIMLETLLSDRYTAVSV